MIAAGFRAALWALLTMNGLTGLFALIAVGPAGAWRFGVGFIAAAILLGLLDLVEHYLDNPPADWTTHV